MKLCSSVRLPGPGSREPGAGLDALGGRGEGGTRDSRRQVSETEKGKLADTVQVSDTE